MPGARARVGTRRAEHPDVVLAEGPDSGEWRARSPDFLKRLATRQLVPFQCRTYRPNRLTAQMSLPEGALAAEIWSVRPAGRAAARQCRPFQCTATGCSVVLCDSSLPPNAHLPRPPAAAERQVINGNAQNRQVNGL